MYYRADVPMDCQCDNRGCAYISEGQLTVIESDGPDPRSIKTKMIKVPPDFLVTFEIVEDEDVP